MGQKVDPRGIRLGISRDWNAKWYADKATFGTNLVEDQKLKRLIKEKCFFAGVSKIEINRNSEKIKVLIHAARPGIIIGKKGSEVEKLNDSIEQVFGKKDISIDIKEVMKPELDAQLVAESISAQLSKRAYFRFVMKKAMDSCVEAGAKGVKIKCSGRLGGADMARKETVKNGGLPLHTLSADIDYGFTEANTTYGNIGVKVWIYR
mgnify:FL=1